MRRDGRGGRIVVPGVRAALLAKQRRFDQWHVDRGDGCSICARIAELEAGEPVQVYGEEIWRAMFDERRPKAWDRFLHDETLYLVDGPDTLHVVDDD